MRIILSDDEASNKRDAPEQDARRRREDIRRHRRHAYRRRRIAMRAHRVEHRQQHKHVQKIGPVARLRERTHDPPVKRAVRLDLPNEHERRDHRDRHPNGTVFDAHLQIDRKRIRFRTRELRYPEIESAAHHDRPRQPERDRRSDRATPGEFGDEPPEPETEQHVADEPAHVMEHTEHVPRALAVEIRHGAERRLAINRRPQAAQVRKRRRDEPEDQPAAQLAFRNLFGPRREQRHQEIQPEQHRHEPEMAAGVREVEARLAPAVAEPPDVGADPYDKRNEDAYQSPPEELARRSLERKKKIA